MKALSRGLPPHISQTNKQYNIVGKWYFCGLSLNISMTCKPKVELIRWGERSTIGLSLCYGNGNGNGNGNENVIGIQL